jgi:hypothetical protein
MMTEGPVQQAPMQEPLQESLWEVSTQEESGVVLIQDVPTWVETAVANVLQPRAPDSRCNQRCCFGPVPQGGGHLDLEVCSPGSSVPGGIALGDVVPAPGSLSAMDPRAAELGLPGYSDTPSPPVS